MVVNPARAPWGTGDASARAEEPCSLPVRGALGILTMHASRTKIRTRRVRTSDHSRQEGVNAESKVATSALRAVRLHTTGLVAHCPPHQFRTTETYKLLESSPT